MVKPILFFVALATLQVLAYGAPGGKIVGGEVAGLETFPYMVSLQIQGSHYCGGSILTRKTVLTAGHCLSAPASEYTIYAGSNRLDGNGQRYRVSSYIIHPEYESDGDTATNDAAVVYLTNDLVFSSLVAPIELETEYIDGGLDVIFSGWGYTSFPGSVPNILQYLNILSIEQSQCEERFSGMYPVNPTQLCTWTKTGEGICFGDSGSPLVRNGKQIGIASWVEPCAIGYPDVYARISNMYRWIDSVIV